MSDPRPIGLFDSGIGGLTVLREVQARLPGESTIYIGDSARHPYGTRSDAEVRTLKAAHWRGGHVMPVGDSLLSGTYFNELLLTLLARDDPHPVLFDGYALAVQQLAHRTVPDAAVLRAFELLLLREVGYLPSLSEDGSSLAPLEPDAWYVLETEGGLALAPSPQRGALQGSHWLAIQAAMTQAAPFTSLVQACRPCMSALQPVLRHLLHYHSGVRSFKTRQMMLDVQALVRKR